MYENWSFVKLKDRDISENVRVATQRVAIARALVNEPEVFC